MNTKHNLKEVQIIVMTILVKMSSGHMHKGRKYGLLVERVVTMVMGAKVVWVVSDIPSDTVSHHVSCKYPCPYIALTIFPAWFTLVP
jgi:hypothetical protein